MFNSIWGGESKFETQLLYSNSSFRENKIRKSANCLKTGISAAITAVFKPKNIRQHIFLLPCTPSLHTSLYTKRSIVIT